MVFLWPLYLPRFTDISIVIDSYWHNCWLGLQWLEYTQFTTLWHNQYRNYNVSLKWYPWQRVNIIGFENYVNFKISQWVDTTLLRFYLIFAMYMMFKGAICRVHYCTLQTNLSANTWLKPQVFACMQNDQGWLSLE